MIALSHGDTTWLGNTRSRILPAVPFPVDAYNANRVDTVIMATTFRAALAQTHKCAHSWEAYLEAGRQHLLFVQPVRYAKSMPALDAALRAEWERLRVHSADVAP